MPSRYIKKILESRIYDTVIETPIHAMHFLSKELGNKILVKREDLQPVFSFKLRGAYNKILQLPEATLKKGVIAASAGNHAQGVALGAARRKARAVIVMPTTTPKIKVDSVRERGAEVVLYGDKFDESLVYAKQLQKERGLTFIHPYDDPDVIAGQGTIGMEIMRQHQERLDAIFVPVGGGGLIAGIASFVKFVRPEIKVIGVECEDSACLYAAMKAGKRVILDKVGIFADGTAVAQIGEEPFRICRQYVDDVITVTPDEICGAIKDLFDDTRSIAETAGALGLAGLKKYAYKHNMKNKVLMTIESGANVNFDRLRYIADRAEIGEKKEALFSVYMPEKPGSLRKFIDVLSGHDVTEFNYRYASDARAIFLLGVQMKNGEEEERALLRKFNKHGYQTFDMSGSELVKMHVSHMIGGRPCNLKQEAVYQIQFPERAGALGKFLDAIGTRWNITMFHYRKHGWIYGDVLIGFDVSAKDKMELERKIKQIKYDCVEQTMNPAYRMFLK